MITRLVGEKRPLAPFAIEGCRGCSADPGERHRHRGCLGVTIGEVLCADGIHEPDGGCCPESGGLASAAPEETTP